MKPSTVQEGTAKASPATSDKKTTANLSRNKEQTNLSKAISTAKKNVKEALSSQKTTYHESVNMEDGWVTLEELQSISQEAYDACIRQLEFERKNSATALEKRKRVIEELKLHSDWLSDEERKELMEALEFLNECDDCKARGVPMPDRSADFDKAQEDNLIRIARKYCCGLLGCSEDVIEMHNKTSEIMTSGNSFYLPILPKDVATLKYQ